MAFATVHHWPDPVAGLRELRRAARRVVVFTCDTTEESWRRRFWLTRDYLPEVAASGVGLATELAEAIGARVEPVLVPWDCADGFFEAYWRRPEACLDGDVRRGMSVWAKVGPDASSEQCAASVMTSHLGGGPNATATSSMSTPQSSAFGCSSPEPASAEYQIPSRSHGCALVTHAEQASLPQLNRWCG